MRITFALAASLLLPFALLAQDERRVSSPNGQVEFRILVAQPNDGGLAQLAYQVYYRGKPALDLSWMGLDIYDQQPLLGEKPGLTHWSSDTTGHDQSGPLPFDASRIHPGWNRRQAHQR